MQGYTYFSYLCRGTHIFLIFAPKHRLCVPTIYVLSKNKKKYHNLLDEKNFQFLKLKKSLFIAWASFRNDIFAFTADGLSAPTGNCSGGWYCTGGSWQAEPADTSSTVDPSACSCPALNYTGGQCWAGTYCPSGTNYPISCDGGWYCGQIGLSAPEGKCDPGTSAVEILSVTPQYKISECSAEWRRK